MVIGETPYAEGLGDRKELTLDSEDIAAVKKMKATGVPVVVIVISGRPLILDPILDQSDAIIAAWLPGTEGGGIADVLFGAYKPTGKLSLHLAEPIQIRLRANVLDFHPPKIFSNLRATPNTISSLQGAPAICTPIGSPVEVSPHRTTAAGHPVRL